MLKCQFSALIPAFDPRPGKTNINQIQDIAVPPSTSPLHSQQPQTQLNAAVSSEEAKQAKLELFLKVDTNASAPPLQLDFFKDEIKLSNKNATIFQYIQNLIIVNAHRHDAHLNTPHYEKMKSIWDANYLLIYREANEDASPTSTNDLPLNDQQPIVEDNIEHILKLLSIIRRLMLAYQAPSAGSSFACDKLNAKLIQQLQDPLCLASRSLPPWCPLLLTEYRFLFPYETRQLYFQTTAFGVSRSIVWLQHRRDQMLMSMRAGAVVPGGSAPSAAAVKSGVASSGVRSGVADDLHEFRIGRLKHERVKIPREPQEELMRAAVNALRFHASRKAILEIEFVDEEGTGLGPTLEFYSLIAAQLQMKKYGLWYCEDNAPPPPAHSEGEHHEAAGFVYQKNGLFPAAYPSTYEQMSTILDYFSFMGIFIAKSLQDQRLIDMPLSYPFLKIICAYKEESSSSSSSDRPKLDDLLDTTSSSIVHVASDSTESSVDIDASKLYLDGVLTLDDLCLIDPHRGNLLKQLKAAIDERGDRDDEIYIELNGAKCTLDDLGLVFEYNPPSKVYGYKSYSLKPDGENILVTKDNVAEYVDLMTKFLLKEGIEKQLQAFKDGFDSVFSMDSLKCFEPYEFQLLLSGDQAPSWTYEDIMNYTEPKLGYSKDSVGFQRFVNVMNEMNAQERKLFVQFLTGCSSLPPGGLANLHPRLTVVKKEGNDASYPSVNTCVHYLKLPEYSSEEVLKRQLDIACQEKGFYLN